MKVFILLAMACLATAKLQPLGFIPMYQNEPRLAAVHPSEVEKLPREFDARKRWPECADVIDNIRTQDGCGSCWAMATVGVISDRLCIATKGATKLDISAEDLLECCGVGPGLCAQSKGAGGCSGGDPVGAVKWYTEHGLVTGSNDDGHPPGCKPYHSDSPYIQADHLKCIPKCENEAYNRTYAADHHFGALYGMLAQDEVSIMKELYENGPLVITLYYGLDGVPGQVQTCSSKEPADHAVRLIGWGVDPHGVKYWLLANSHGRGNNVRGFFKVRRGTNECHIEEYTAFTSPRV